MGPTPHVLDADLLLWVKQEEQDIPGDAHRESSGW